MNRAIHLSAAWAILALAIGCSHTEPSAVPLTIVTVNPPPALSPPSPAISASAALPPGPVGTVWANAITVPRGIWRSLLRHGARWELFGIEPNTRLIAEVTETRHIGDADVIRLRWFRGWKDGQEAFSSGVPERIAVSDRGIYFLNPTLDDAHVIAALAGPATDPDPPVPIDEQVRPDGHYVSLSTFGGESIACVGSGPLPDAGMCDDTCFAQLCIAAHGGIVAVVGTWAPNHGIYRLRGYEQ